MNLRLAGCKTDSIVDGPGIRMAVFVQGCSHRCPGCHNPETHDPSGGYDVSVSSLVEIISRSSPIDGVTLSGGEPFEQAAPAAALAVSVAKCGLDLVIYSGYTFEELWVKSIDDRNTAILLETGLLLIDGPFILQEQDLTLPYRGSRNQRLIDLPNSMKAGKAIMQADFSGAK